MAENKELEKDNNQEVKQSNYATIIGAGIMILSVFIPFLTITFLGMSQSFSLMDLLKHNINAGPIVLIVGILVLLFIGAKNSAMTILGSIVNLIVFFYIQSEITRNLARNSYSAQVVSSMFQKGIGYYMLLFGPIVTIIAEIYAANKDSKAK